MKYKVLINGGNSALLRDFFMNTNDFKCVSTSGFWADISEHYEMFEPDAYVCIAEYTDPQVMALIKRLKTNEVYGSVPVILITDEDCYDFYSDENEKEHFIDLILSRPIKISAICENITKLLRSIEMEQQRAAKEAEETERRVKEKKSAEKKSAEKKSAVLEKDDDDEQPEKKHILVVDDDKNVLKLLKAALEGRFEVTTIAGGRMARKFLETKVPDLIFLDYEMPIENRPEVFRRIKSNDSTKDIPVVFLTGIAEREKITEVLSLKPQGYLLKPIDMERVNETIKRLLG